MVKDKGDGTTHYYEVYPEIPPKWVLHFSDKSVLFEDKASMDTFLNEMIDENVKKIISYDSTSFYPQKEEDR